MTDLSHWDFAKDFSGQEAAALIVGIEPGTEIATTYQHQEVARKNRTRISPVISRMRDCYAQAWFSYEYLLSPLTDKPRPFESEELHSVEMQRLFSRTIPGDMKSEQAFDAWMMDKDQTDFENQRFTRDELSRWLSAIGVKPAYQFCRETQIEEPAASPLDKPLGSRERTSYLNIIGAMLAQLTAGKANDTTVITQAVTDYGTKHGISERKLQEVFAAAKRSLVAN